MRGRYTQIHQSQIRHCNKCGREICFVQNRNGKWFAVDVVYPQRVPSYKHSAGAYNNMIPWHRCLPQRDLEGERLVKQAQRLSACIARHALSQYRADPNVDQTRLCQVMERNDARIARRTASLPAASRAYVQC